MRLLIMGAPGAGKGTQAQGIASHYGIPPISTGSMFRESVARGTELGCKIEQLLASGEFVPDQLTEQVVAERLQQPDASKGWLLDGYPRTMHQVSALDDFLSGRGQTLDAVIALTVNRESLVARLVLRGTLEGRSDDNEQTIRRRFDNYETQTRPLLAEYARRGLVLQIDGAGPISEVSARIAEALDVRKAQV